MSQKPKPYRQRSLNRPVRFTKGGADRRAVQRERAELVQKIRERLAQDVDKQSGDPQVDGGTP